MKVCMMVGKGCSAQSQRAQEKVPFLPSFSFGCFEARGFVMASSYPNQCAFEQKTPEFRANSGGKSNLEPDPLNFGINYLTIMFWYVKLESIGLNFEPRTVLPR
jgi:hypothetical protein